jgi:PKD repeat protein
MIKRLRDFARKDDAVIEVFSEILLTGIIVLAIAAAAAFVLSSLDEPDNVRVDIDHWADKDSDTLYFRHSGGETVDVEDLELMVYVNGSYETLSSGQIRSNYDSDEWALGDIIEINTSSHFNYDITDGKVPSKLVHTASSLVIYDAYGSIGDSGAVGGGGADDEGDTASAPQLSNPNPTSPYTSAVQDNVTFSATSNQSSDNEFLLNGTRVAWSNGTSPSYTNTTPSVGTYNLTLIAHNQTDPSLTDSISWVWMVEAVNQFPIADFSYSPSSPEADQDITFDASVSSDPDGSITDYEWDWTNDGSYYATTSATATHSYSSPGSYDVKLRVTDDDGNTNNTTKIVNVVGLLYNNDAIAKDGPDNPSPDKAGGVEFSIQNLYGSTVTIDSIKINPANDDIDKLSDDIAPNNKTEYVEVYAEGDIDGYSDFYDGVSIPPEGLEVAIGQDGDETSGVSPQVNSNNVMKFYIFEFYEEAGQSGNFNNVNMQGKAIEITINYTVGDDQKSKNFTITPQ